MRKLLLWLLLFGWPTLLTAQTYFPVPVRQQNAITDLGPNGSVAYHRALFFYSGDEIAQAQLFRGIQVDRFGFHITTPASSAATGTLRLWIGISPDTLMTRGPVWSTVLTTPSPLTKVYDGPLTIPAQPGWFDIVFNQPGAGFTIQPFSRAGYYIAYEWEATSTSTAPASYTSATSMRTIISATGPTPPPILGSPGLFRPWIRFGTAATIRYPDPAILKVYTVGRVPLVAGAAAPQRVQILLTNNGTEPLVAGQGAVLLSIAGPPLAPPFQVTRPLPAIAPGDTVRLWFPGWQPTLPGDYYAYCELLSGPDSVYGNNEGGDSILVRTRMLSYASTGRRDITGAVGFGTGSGSLLNRYVAPTPVAVAAVRPVIGGNFQNPGKTIFGVVLDSAGHLLARSADYVIGRNDSYRFVQLALPTPLPVVRGTYFVGIAQPADPQGQPFFPLATQREFYIRDSAYYSVVGDSALTGLKPPREFKALGRMPIAVEFAGSPVGTPEAARAATTLHVFPNPANEQIRVEILGGLAGEIYQVSWWDTLGRLVQRQPATSSGSVLDVSGLTPGVYQLTLTGSSSATTYRTRLVIQR